MMRDVMRRLVGRTTRSRRRTRPGGPGGVCSLVELLEDRCLLSAHIAGVIAGESPGLARHGRPEVLPAVQNVQAAAARTQVVADMHNPGENARLGTQLPAIQNVDGMRGNNNGNNSGGVGQPRGEDFELPAVQNVLAAAARARNGFELPAIQNVQAASNRLRGPGDPTDPPNDDGDPPGGQDDPGGPDDPGGQDNPGGTDDPGGSDGTPGGGDPTGPPNPDVDPPAGQDDPGTVDGSPDDGDLNPPSNDDDFDLPGTLQDETETDVSSAEGDATILSSDDFSLVSLPRVRSVANRADLPRGDGVLIALPNDDSVQPSVQNERDAAAQSAIGFDRSAVPTVPAEADSARDVGEQAVQVNGEFVLPIMPLDQVAGDPAQEEGDSAGIPHDAVFTPALLAELETTELAGGAADENDSGERTWIGLVLGAIAGFLTAWALRSDTNRERATQHVLLDDQPPTSRRRRFRRRS